MGVTGVWLGLATALTFLVVGYSIAFSRVDLKKESVAARQRSEVPLSTEESERFIELEEGEENKLQTE